jgi:hypothetical protein
MDELWMNASLAMRPAGYQFLPRELKQGSKTAQLRAGLDVNRELVLLHCKANHRGRSIIANATAGATVSPWAFLPRAAGCPSPSSSPSTEPSALCKAFPAA